MLATGIARPLIRRGIKAAGEWFLRTDDEGFAARLTEVRERAAQEVDKRRAKGETPSLRTETPGTATDDASAAGALT